MSSQAVARRYRLTLITAELDGREHLVLGEAVEAAADSATSSVLRYSDTVLTPAPVVIRSAVRTADEGEVERVLDDIRAGASKIDGRAIASDPLVDRPAVLVPAGEVAGFSLSPDDTHTYRLHEAWSAQETALYALRATRRYPELSAIVKQQVGWDIAAATDRVGNFLRFDRVSSWRLETRSPLDKPVRHVRALDGDQPAATTMRLHTRFLEQTEIADESIVDLPPHGAQFTLSHDTASPRRPRSARCGSRTAPIASRSCPFSATSFTAPPVSYGSRRLAALSRAVSDPRAKRVPGIKMSRRPSAQLTLDDARKPTGHGGWRPRAGRPRGRTTVAHDARECFAPRFPVHVTVRAVEGIGSLRRGPVVAAVRAALTAGGRRDTFRVVEFAVLGNHLHLIAEAEGKVELARGMNGLVTRLARGINKALGRTGALFATRYHSRVLRSPREVKHALRYVLLNARHHAAERGEALFRGWIDPCSSAPWFRAWREPSPCRADWLVRLRSMPRPTAEPATWLLRSGWQVHGLLVVDDAPT